MAETTTNKIRFGFSNVYHSVLTEATGTDGTVSTTWATPKAWKGGRSISLSAEGEQSTYYADDGSYFTTSSNNGYSGTLTMARDDDEFLKDVLGYVATSGGGVAEKANVLPKSFALIFQCKGDATNTRYCYLKCTPSRPGFEANTKEEGISPDETALDIVVSPVEDANGDTWVKRYVKEGEDSYASWFTTAPTLPEEAA